MKLREVQVERIKDYLHLAPVRILERLNEEETYGIAAYDEDEEEVPEGLLCFFRQKGDDEVVIYWIFVREQKRREGIARAMMGEVFARVRQRPCREVCANIYEKEGVDFIQSFFMQYGFRFEPDLSYELLKPLSELLDGPVLAAARLPKDYCNVRQAGMPALLRFLEGREGKNDLGHIPRNRALIDEEISCVHVSGGEVDAAFLFSRFLDGTLRAFYLGADGEEQRKMHRLIMGAIALIREHYSEKTMIYVRCTTAASGKLIDEMAPGSHPVRIRRGEMRLPRVKEGVD